jgi:hypothetical protein
VRYELGFYIPEDGILHSHRHENLKSYMACFVVVEVVTAVIMDIAIFWDIAPCSKSILPDI